MATIPQAVLDKQPPVSGLTLIRRGKVRDSYALPDHEDKMLVVASDRCSIFDIVLKVLIPFKGPVLTALNYFWVSEVLKDLFETDLVACGAGIDEFLPEGRRNNVDLQTRATVVERLKSPDVEDIVRFILTGSAWKSYQNDRRFCGHLLPGGLVNGSPLPFPIYTPSTKEESGHDVNIDVDGVIARYGYKRERIALKTMGMMASYAESRGIKLGDGKLEMDGCVIIDEKGTPDSCRFMDLRTYQTMIAKGKLAPSLDKQYVRNYGIKLGIDKLNPEDPADLEKAHSIEIPGTIIDMTTRLYRYIFWRLTGMQLEAFQNARMGINIAPPKRKIEILVGSESDIIQTRAGTDWLRGHADYSLSIFSCHRNTADLPKMAERLAKADIVIAGAGVAAALPGMIKAHLCAIGSSHIPVIGVGFAGKSARQDEAARRSIDELPGTPVELAPNGEAYFGLEGFLAACQSAVNDEFLPKTIEPKPVQLDVITSS